jgi:hypothetical protein
LKLKEPCKHDRRRTNQTQVRCARCGEFIERRDERMVKHRWPSCVAITVLLAVLATWSCARIGMGQEFRERDDWQPVPVQEVAYPGPICQWLSGGNRAQGNRQPNVASQQPQLPSTYARQQPGAQLDLSQLVKRSELDNYLLRDEFGKWAGSAKQNFEQHTGVINQLREQLGTSQGAIEQAKQAINQHAAGLGDRIAALEKVGGQLAQTPAGAAALEAAPGVIEGLFGAGTGALIKTSLVTAGPWGAVAALIGTLAYRRLSSKISARVAGPGGAAPADPFRATPQPTATGDPENYRTNR